MRKVMIGGALVMLALAGYPSERASDVDGVAWNLQRLAQGGGADERTTALFALDALARQYRRQAEESPPVINKFGNELIKPGANRCWRMLVTLRTIGDKRSLPLFEEMTASTDRGIRTTAVIGYMDVAGTMDSLPFIGRLMVNPHYTNHERALLYVDLQRRMEAPPPEDMEKICAFMLERSLVEEDDAMTTLDSLLCQFLPGYSTSVQRSEFIDRAYRLGTEGARNYWNPHKEAMDNVPVQERKDFRAKGELLDPERKGKQD